MYRNSSRITDTKEPVYNLEPLDLDEWNIFKHRGLHFLHLNTYNLLPKIHKLWHIARLTNATAIGTSESELNDSVLTSESQIDEYDRRCCERNRYGRRLAFYIRDDLSYNAKSYFPKHIENIFFALILRNIKPAAIGTICFPRKQTDFMEIFNENLSKMCGRMVIMFSKNIICFHVNQS